MDLNTEQSSTCPEPMTVTFEASAESVPPERLITNLLEAILAELKAINKRQDRIWMID